MANSIRTANLHINNKLPDWVTGSLVPFLNEIPVAAAEPWPWTDERVVADLADETWAMLGRWQARRAVTIDQADFNKRLPTPVAELAKLFNAMQLESLASVAALRGSDRSRWLEAVVLATMQLSAIKPTNAPKPMFGSKILHHFFPSIAPVYDTKRVEKGLMRGEEFVRFNATIDEALASPSSSDNWCDVAARFEAGLIQRTKAERELLELAVSLVRYLTFCAQLVESADQGDLNACRTLLLDQFSSQPERRSGDVCPIAACLDAKIAEFCASAVVYAPAIAPTTWANPYPSLSFSYVVVYADSE